MKHAVPETRWVATRWVGIILILYLLIGLTHSVVNPIFESSDEWSHYPFVEHVARGDGLPVQQPGKETLWRHEGSQPPLYYLLMGTLTSWIDTHDLPQIMTPNPHARIGIALARDNKNMIIHTAAEDWPWRGTVLAVHLVRLASVLMGAVTVFFAYLIARELVPDEPGVAILAMALTAFLPMFAFISASVNNDNITYMLSSIAFLLIVRASRRRPALRDLLLLGVVLGLAALSKLSGLVLLPIAALGVVISHWRQKEHSFFRETGFLGSWFLALLRDLVIMAIPVIVLATWWYIRNIVLYGDPTGLTVLNTFIAGRDNTPWWRILLSEWEAFRITFWGLFGGVNVLMQPIWIYRVLDAIALAALIGLMGWVALRLRRRTPTRWVELGLGCLYVVLLTIGVARYTLSTPATQGRLIFPGIGVIMTFVALGLIGWAPAAWRPLIGAPVAGLLFALTISSPFTAIRSAYAPPPTIAPSDVPQTMQGFDATFNDEVTLLGYQFGKMRVHPGEELPVTLFWQTHKQPSENYSLYLKVFGRNNQVLGESDVYPGRGTLPTSSWPLDRIVVDTLYVPITAEPAEPLAADVRAGLYRYEGRANLPVKDGQGQVIESPLLSRVKVYGPSQVVAPENALNLQFGEGARLAGYNVEGDVRPGQEFELRLHWAPTGSFERDYTVFVQLLGTDGKAVAYGDAAPQGGAYPTSFWEAGEYVVDGHRLAVPADLKPGVYRVLVGLYDPKSGERVPIVDESGKVIGDAAQGIEVQVEGA